MLGLPPPRPVQPGELDHILDELADRGIEPTRLRILRRAVERGCASDLAAAVADAFDQRNEHETERAV
jgi:hypothetical protein